LWLDILEAASEDIEGFCDRKDIPFFDNIPYGCIVAVGKIVDCQKMFTEYAVSPDKQFIHIGSRSITERRCGDWTDGRYAWKLDNVNATDPFPCQGRQGIQDLPMEIFEKLRII
jgi:hypothetical protein